MNDQGKSAQPDKKPSDQPDSNTNSGEHSNQTGDANKRKAPQFDWVTQRSQCSLPKVFKTLREEIEQDVKTRNGLRPANSPYEFSVTENGSDFTVVLNLNDVQTSVTFSLAEHAILVRNHEGKTQFEVTLAFDDLGECKLFVNEEERQRWQVRRMALEELMFRGY